MIKSVILLITITIIIIIIIQHFNKVKDVYTPFEYPPFKIDLVYTWGGEHNDKFNIKTSYNNELKYSLRSVFKNIDWFNKIYIVINTPIESNFPSWFNELYSDRINIIDQKQIFPVYKHLELPCKVADIIETYIHLIPGLSEHFIYLNDDFFVNKPLNYTEFFNKSGTKIKVNKKVSNYEKMNFNDILKFENYPFNNKGRCYHGHILYPITISSRKRFINEYSDWISWVRNTKYNERMDIKNCNQFGLYTTCQAIHYPYYIYMYIHENAIINKKLYDTYIAGDKRFQRGIRRIKSNTLFFVINNTEFDYSNIVTDFLEKKYNNKLYFEK